MTNKFIKNIEQNVIRFIDRKSLLNKSDRVLVALSGGADSVFLLHFLNKYKQRFKIQISAVHINHRLRGNEAAADELFCKKICSDLKVELFLIQKNVKVFAKRKKYSIEEAGRIIRYKEFEKISEKEGFDKIATAHNANDNTESVLLNISRGSGIAGISGIAVKRNKIIRPILCLTKEDILKYLELIKNNYKVDSTNFSIDFERNFIRHKIVPLLIKKINTSLHKSLLRSSENISEINQFVERSLKSALSQVKKNRDEDLFIANEVINSVPEELLIDFFKKILIENFDETENSNNAKNLVLLLNLETGKTVKLSGELFACLERDGLLIAKKKDHRFSEKKISIGGSVNIFNGKLSIKKVSRLPKELGVNRNIEYIDADKVDQKLTLRNWTAGDRFKPLGMRSSKKISDFLTDSKISSYKKKEKLVLLSANKVVWVIGSRLDDRFKVTKTTKNYLELKYYESK
ncbi:MAG: tRNA lysidine(34) synthetase TilS [Ignavibacteriales bacterium]|nr:tRNA lysidine(34) synthetase TilS [Ignavibacteriales bacterium]